MKLYIKPKAADDLREIYNYISKKLKNPIAARNTTAKIKKTYSMLREQPFIGISLETKTEMMSDYSFLVSGSYIIIYRVRETEGIVEISRIFGGRQNYISEIFD